MKAALAALLIVLLLVVALPIGLGHMVDCPACTPTKSSFALGLCSGILSLIALTVVFSSSRFHLAKQTSRRFLLALSIFRPPRFA